MKDTQSFQINLSIACQVESVASNEIAVLALLKLQQFKAERA
jgi:hypothetical protein